MGDFDDVPVKRWMLKEVMTLTHPDCHVGHPQRHEKAEVITAHLNWLLDNYGRPHQQGCTCSDCIPF